MKVLFLLLFNLSLFGQVVQEPIIPAGNIVTPVSLPYIAPKNYVQKSPASEAFDISMRNLNKSKNEQVQDTVSKTSFSDRMNTLNDDKFNFEEYNVKPEEVYVETSSGNLEYNEDYKKSLENKNNVNLPSQDKQQGDSGNSIASLAGMLLGLICVLITIIVLMFSKKAKRI